MAGAESDSVTDRERTRGERAENVEQQHNYTYKFLKMSEEGGPFKDRIRLVYVIRREEDPIFLGYIKHESEPGWLFAPAVDPLHITYIEARCLPDLMDIFADIDRRLNHEEVLSDEEKAVKK